MFDFNRRRTLGGRWGCATAHVIGHQLESGKDADLMGIGVAKSGAREFVGAVRVLDFFAGSEPFDSARHPEGLSNMLRQFYD